MDLYLTNETIAYFRFLLFLLGLCMGSFSNAWAWRISSGEPITKGRSHCTVCGHTLMAWDLIPLFSWLFLKGRCRYCKAPIPLRYPAAEAVCGLYFITVAVSCSFDLQLLRLLLLGPLLLVMSLEDLDRMQIEDHLIVLAAALSLLRLLNEGLSACADMALGLLPAAMILGLVLYMDRKTGKETMGGADIKLTAALGLHFGPYLTLLILILSSLAGLLLAFLFRKKNDPIPFGPCLALGAWAAAVCGPSLLSFYFRLF